MDGSKIPFDKATFSAIPQVAEILALPPTARRFLFEEGVPRYFFHRNFSADPELSVVRTHGISSFVRFGVDSYGFLGVDCSSGNVLHVGSGPSEQVTFVNTTLGNFADTARILTEEFPYGASLTDPEENDEAANRMRTIIRAVDSDAARPGSYWPNFPDEVDGWLYCLGEIIEWYRNRHLFPSDVNTTDSQQGKSDDDIGGRLF